MGRSNVAHICRSFIFYIVLTFSALASETKIIVHTATGGNMIHARVFAQHWQRHSGNLVNIKIVPGATGVVAANYLYNIAAKDGSEIAAIDSRVTFQFAAKSDGVKYNITKFKWLGSAVDGRKEPYVLWAKAGPASMIAGIEGGSSINHIRFLSSIMRWNVKEVIGYADSTQTKLAFEKGEINLVSYSLTGIRSTNPHWLSDNSIIPLVQYGGGLARNPSISLTPTAMELASTEKEKELVEDFERFLTLSRPFAAPPEVGEEKVAKLRQLFSQIMQDELYRADALKIGVYVTPIYWQETEKIVDKISNAQFDVVSKLKQF